FTIMFPLPLWSTLFPYTTLFRSVGLLRLHQLLEGVDRRLAVLVVRVDDRPALLVELHRLGDQHRRLHVRGRTQAIGVAVAVGPGDRKSTRLNSSHVKISYAVFCL